MLILALGVEGKVFHSVGEVIDFDGLVTTARRWIYFEFQPMLIILEKSHAP